MCGEISNGLLLFEFKGTAIEGQKFNGFWSSYRGVRTGDLVNEIRNRYERVSPSGEYSLVGLLR